MTGAVPRTPWLTYDTASLLPWSCARCQARVATHRLCGVRDGGPTYYCWPCGQQVVHDRAPKETP